MTAPVVVTLDMDGGIVDVVGDLGLFVGEGDTAEAVVARLFDLTCGEGGMPETLAAVELSDGRFADIHVLAEGESRHFVLRDVSAPMRMLQKRQQLDHEAELGQRRAWKAMGRDANDAERSKRLQARKVFRQSAGLLETVSVEMREPLSLLSGHVRILARRFQGDPATLRSLAAMEHAAMRLEALSTNALIGLGELSASRTERGVVELGLLAGFLQDAFALQAEMRGIGFEICAPGMSTLVEVDDLDLRRLLVNLVVHALDGMEHGLLRVSLSASDRGLEVELEADPDGLPVQRFGELVTTVDLLRSNARGSLLLAASQCLLQRLDAAVELVERREGGHLLWFRLPVRPVLAGNVDVGSSTMQAGALGSIPFWARLCVESG